MDTVKRKPEFIIIGAAKAGTTSLYKKLNMHPNIFMSNPKEPEFFARDDVYSRGEDWYLELFSTAKTSQICGEASTLYSQTQLYPETVNRMHSLLPDVKLIYVLRDPVRRAFSYYTQLIKNYQNSTNDYSVNRTFEECIYPELNGDRASREKFFAGFDHHLPDVAETFIGGGRYMTNIKNYLKLYPRENLLLVDFDDLVADMDSVIDTICQFINVDNQLLPKRKNVKVNVSSEHFKKIDLELKKSSDIETLKSIPLVESISKVIPRPIRQKIMAHYAKLTASNIDTSRPKRMQPSTKDNLKKFYQVEIEELEKFWQKDLSSWK